MYRKNGHLAYLPAKIVPSGWVGFSGSVFWGKLQNPKKFHKVLDFQRFAVLE